MERGRTVNGPRPVLVVERNEALRHRYWQALTFEGFYVITAADVPGAVECLRHTVPAVVVLDTNVFRRSDTQLHRDLASSAEMRRVPIIAMTDGTPEELARQVAAVLPRQVPVTRIVEEVRRYVTAA